MPAPTKRLFDVPTGVIGDVWILSHGIRVCLPNHILVTRSGERCVVTDENSVYDHLEGVIWMTNSTLLAVEERLAVFTSNGE